MAVIALWICVACAVAIPFAQAIPGPIDIIQDTSDKVKYPEIKGPFRVEVDIIRLDNPRGTTRSWMPCDVFGSGCDPKVTGVIDYFTPNYDFGKDSVPFSRYLKLWEGKSVKSFDINQQMVKDVCRPHSTRKIKVRIRALDKDWFSDDSIDNFGCLILTTDPPAENERSAKWSEPQSCTGHNSAHKILWRYKWYFIPDSDCKEVAGSSGWLRRNTPFLGK